MTKNELYEYLNEDKNTYLNQNFFKRLYDRLTQQSNFIFYKQIVIARKFKYYQERNKGIFNKFMFVLFSRKNNQLGRKNHTELHGNFGRKLKIYHPGVIITKYATVGDNVKLHGMNCIGIKSNILEEAPKIGNNVELGYGACVIGNVSIGNNIIIGANSVVTKSFLEEGIVLAGIPARRIK